MNRDCKKASKTELINMINEWVFNKRDREIAKKHMLDSICFTELAEEYCLSVSRVKQIYHDCKAKIEEHISEA